MEGTWIRWIGVGRAEYRWVRASIYLCSRRENAQGASAQGFRHGFDPEESPGQQLDVSGEEDQHRGQEQLEAGPAVNPGQFPFPIDNKLFAINT